MILDAGRGSDVDAVVARSDLVLDALPRAVVVSDRAGTIRLWNARAAAVFGWDAAEVVGRSVFDVVLAGTDRHAAPRIVDQVLSGAEWTGDLGVTRRDGSMATVSTSVRPLRDDDGAVVGLLSTSDDVGERHTLERRTLDLTDHLLLALAAGELGTWRWDMATGVTTWDATMEQLFGLAPGTFDGTFDAWVALLHPDDVARSVGLVDQAVADKGAYEVEHRVVWPDGSIHWLHGRGKAIVDDSGNVVGTIGCSGDVTARKQLEIDAGRRIRAAERLADRERIERQRLQYLADLDDAALEAGDHRELMTRVAAAAVPGLGDWCVLHFVADRGTAPEMVLAHADPAKVRWANDLYQRFGYDPDAPTGVPSVIRSGRMEFVRDIDQDYLDGLLDASDHLAARDELRAIVEVLQLTSVITVPLRTKRGVIGAMQFVSAESGRRYDNDDVSLAHAAAGRIAAALDSSWHTEQLRLIARELQAGLLPLRLPEIPGVDVAVRYWAAGLLTEVGGDFYDVFPIDDRRWAIVIGDVCGTGPEAAGVTAIVRHTVRAAATHGADPAAVLDWANAALLAAHRRLFCTAIYSTLERSDDGAWRYTVVAGGHPLPVLVGADGRPRCIGTPGTLLGVVPVVTATPRHVELVAGDTIVLYTDGVTDVAPPFGLEPEQLQQLVAGAVEPGGTADEIAARLGEAIAAVLPIPERNDDVAIVVARVTPQVVG